MARFGVKRGIILSLFIILFLCISVSFARGYVSINFPGNGNLGKFLQDKPLVANFNITFDVPFPLGEGETTLTAKITRPDGSVYDEETIPMKPLLEKHKIVSEGKYVYKPNLFEYNITLTGKNVTYVGVPFTYSINQNPVPPVGRGNRLWKIQGRHITDSQGTGDALKDKYCSGPWDFDGPGAPELCATKTSCGTEEDEENGEGCAMVGEYCSGNDDCCSGNCVEYECADKDCPTGTYACENSCCIYGWKCCESRAPNRWICCQYDCNYDTGGCRYLRSFIKGTKIQLPEGTKDIEQVKEGEEILSFENGEIVEKGVSFVISHRSDHYYILKTKNREVEVTGNHEFYIGENEFKSVEDLRKGEKVYVLEDGKLVPEEIVSKELVREETDVYDLGIEGTRTYFASGFAVHNRMISFATVPGGIQKLAWDPNSTASLNSETILYFENLESKDVPNEPGEILVAEPELYCQTSHSWLFETHIYPSITKTASFKVYPDSGARIYLDKLSGNGWSTVESLVCRNGCENEANKDKYSQGCDWTGVGFEKNKWYRLRVYLFNNPGGLCTQKKPPTGNPMGIKIVDWGSYATSLVTEFGGEDTVVNSEPPGQDEVITGSSSISANEGLKEIVDVKAFSVEYVVDSGNSNVTLTMRGACGNSEYKVGNDREYTDQYGWILDRTLPTYSWDIQGNDRAGSIHPFDAFSLSVKGRNLYRPDGKNIGGIYKCHTTQLGCPANEKYFDKTHNKYCCLKKEVELDGDDGEIIIKNYEGFYSYIINYLPATGSKLCAYTEEYGTQTPVNYVSNFNNTQCDEENLQKCCFCTKDFGCALGCLNKEGKTGSHFPPPFDMSGPNWEIINLSFNVIPAGFNPFDERVDFEWTGDSQMGWDVQASYGSTGDERLYINHTIPLNLYDDFKLVTPSNTGRYDVAITLNHGDQSQSNEAFFNVVECLWPGEESDYYDETTYPGTKNVGTCEEGTRTCSSNNEWFYETLFDQPVYPKTGEQCDGLDEDCNGIVDDIGGFDNIIQQFIDSGGRKTPKQITKCGCFGGSEPSDEICNNIDDDCDGAVDNSQKVLTINTCDQAVIQCEAEGNPYTWCLQFYNSSTCSFVDITFNMPNTTMVNTCTKSVRKCLENKRYNNVTGQYESLTYGECKKFYHGDCLLETIEVKTLGSTCYCSGGVNADPSIIAETCNGVDDNCNGIIDDVANPETCACAFADVNRTMFYKSLSDTSCDGIDNDCNGVIDDSASLCACRERTYEEVVQIKLAGKDICDNMDNDCDGLIDEGFPNLGKPCGYGVCFGGSYVCNVYGDGEVCNTTVDPGGTYLGNAFDYRTAEACDLKDNDCDGSIDEDNCTCTPSDIGIKRICGYESGIYYKNEDEIKEICDQTLTQLSRLLSWVEAPGNAFYRRLVVMNNRNDFGLENYPAKVVLDTGSLVSQNKLRPDGGDLRITEIGKEEHIDWINSDPFTSGNNNMWFRVNIPKNSERRYYLYYGDPAATYSIPGATSVIGLPKRRETLLLCHFDDTTECEGNVLAAQSSGLSYQNGKYEEGLVLGNGLLTYPTSENINKERGSIEFWVKPDNPNADQYLFYLEDLGEEPQFSLHFSSGGTYFEIYDKNRNKHSLKGGSLNREWNHIAATWDVLYGIKLYINGELEDSKNFAWGMNELGMDMYAGSMESGKQVSGVIDEFTIYSYALSPNEVKRDMRGYDFDVTMGEEENLNRTTTTTTTKDIYLKCTQFLENVTQTLTNQSIMYTILSLCDSVRICNKTFPINFTSRCMIGTQTCSGGLWTGCTGIFPTTEVCNNMDDDCNGIIDDVANPETCACSYGGQPGEEECNGIDDNCNTKVDDVRGGNSKEETHCGCYDELVNITQKVMEPEAIDCNGIDDNCNGLIDEGLSSCACSYTIFNSTTDNVTSVMGSPETCNMIDDNCNMVVDDPYQEGGSAVGSDNYLGAQCGPLNSRCAGGVYVCSEDGTQTVCDTMSDEGMAGNDLRVPESCNAIDDDCNFVIDDVWGEDSGDYCQCYNGIPESDEVCDGKDNNCDGTIDNIENTRQCACFIDLRLNVTNIQTIAANITSIKYSEEICNNIDDNCNKGIDETLETVCFCSGGFSGNPEVRPELCNGADDDCDGIIDEVTFPEMCACYNGTHSRGELAETCDRVDNDCNGLVDEEWIELGSACGYGVCSGGAYECTTDGSGTVCSTIGGSDNKADTEVCDGIDNNCDFVVDEGCPCSPGENMSCGIDVGICEKGYQACVNGQWSNCIGGKGPQIEVCNLKDDNCDGVVDNVGGGTTPNSARCTCYAGAARGDEVCDGTDNDCNGVIDDVGEGNSVESSKCACYNGLSSTGINLEVCNGIDDDCDGTIDNVKGGISVEVTKCGCFGGFPKTDEICDGIDNDCNGVVDDSWPDAGETCGLGVCTGIYVCTEDGTSTECSGGDPSPEVHDGKDNNCDGIVDNMLGEKLSVCGNGICEGSETEVTCPQDCKEGEPYPGRPPILPGTWVIVFIAIIVIIVIVGVALTFMK